MILSFTCNHLLLLDEILHYFEGLGLCKGYLKKKTILIILLIVVFTSLSIININVWKVRSHYSLNK